MKYYSRNHSGNTKVRQIMLRILFVLVAAAIITFSSIALGNYLQHKVELAEENAVSSSDLIGLQMERHPGGDDDDGSGYHSPTVFGAGIDLTAYHTSEALSADVRTLAQTYDTLTVSLIGEDGELIYTSPAMCRLTRLPVPEVNPVLDKIAAVAETAHSLRMRLCARISVSADMSIITSAAVIDGTLIAELQALGFDEVLLSLSDEYRSEIDYDSANRIRAYLTECTKYSDCPIGVLLNSELYLNATMAKQVQMIASACTFLGITFPMDAGSTTADVYRSVTGGITNLMGSFSVYNMRVIIGKGEWGLMSAQYNACLENDITNLCFTTAVALDKLSYSGPPEEVLSEHEPVLPAAPETGEANPYTSPDGYDGYDEAEDEDGDGETDENIGEDEDAFEEFSEYPVFDEYPEDDFGEETNGWF